MSVVKNARKMSNIAGWGLDTRTRPCGDGQSAAQVNECKDLETSSRGVCAHLQVCDQFYFALLDDVVTQVFGAPLLGSQLVIVV